MPTSERLSSRGIAIPLVLGAITILSALATDFAYNSMIHLRLAANARDRLQAEYLAQSAMSFLRLELKLDKTAKHLIAQLPAGTQGAGNGPLCKQYPISTALLKAIFIPSAEGGAVNEEAKAVAEKARMVTVFDKEVAQEFLGFRGDFAAECADEGGKLNLNVFVGLDPAAQTLSGLNAYDRFKEMMTTFLAHERFKELFDTDQPYQMREAIRNIADWVDANDQMNEKGGAQGGAESSLYNGPERGYKVKNGKLLSLDEAYLVAGVTDDWFTPLKDFFTVYGDAKINFCAAPPEVVEAVVTAYALGNPKFPAFNPANKPLMEKIADTVEKGCGGTKIDPTKLSQDIETALGTAAAGETKPESGSTAVTGSTLANLIATEPRFFRLTGTGEVGDVVVRITTIMDVKEGDAKKWKVLYWHLE